MKHKRIGYKIALVAVTITSTALIAKIAMQILDISELTLKQVVTATATMVVCAAVMGDDKK